MYNDDLSLKQGNGHLKEKKIINNIIYTMFDNHEWTRIILRKIHENMFWVGDILVTIDSNLIQKLTTLRNEG